MMRAAFVEALLANKAMRGLFRHGNIDRLDNLQKKSPTTFAFGANQHFGAPVVRSRAVVSG